MDGPILKNATLIDYYGQKRINAQIFNDDRFPEGEWVITSQVKEIKTRNTDYKIESWATGTTIKGKENGHASR